VTSDPKTKPEEDDKVEAETPNDSEKGKLSLEELAVVTGGDGDDDAWFTSPGPWDDP
jgi:hypothetical protein